MTIAEAFEIAVRHHQAGRLAEAEGLYRQILAVEPRHPDTLHLLGVVAHQVGRHDVAAELILQAIALAPTVPVFHCNLGAAYAKLGRIEDAAAAYRRALQFDPGYSEAHNNLGNVLKDQGKLGEAIREYRRALELRPDFAEAHNNYGVALTEQGQPGEAVSACRRALELKPDYAEAESNLGAALAALGRLDEAVGAYHRALELKPDFVDALVNLGNALHAQGHPDEATGAFHRALRIRPDFAMAHYNLGNVLKSEGRFEDAIASYRCALQSRPGFAEAWGNLGIALQNQGRPDDAIAAYRRAIESRPDYAEAHNNLGNALQRQRQMDAAIAAYRRAIECKTDYAEAHSNLGLALADRGHFAEGFIALRHALLLKPDLVEAHNNLGMALAEQGRLDEALAAYRRALEFNPDLVEAHNNLANALKDHGELAAAIAAYRHALRLKPDHPEAHGNLLLALHYPPGCDPGETLAEHRRWAEIHALPLAKGIAPHGNDRDPERRLRIGYVSPDFREHSVAFFLEGLLAAHDGGQVEIFCYADLRSEDAVSARFEKLSGHWRRIAGRTDEQVAELIRQDRIDILIDLSGHTARNRLLVFARKPAPVQVTYLGYCDTTGLSAMDYRLTDALADPPGTTEHLHTEQLIRLPDGAWCFRPHDQSPAVEPPPVLRSGHITFGCFNVRPKITDEMLILWARLLSQVPGSRLLLKNTGFTEPSIQQRMRNLLAKAGIAPERLELAARVPTQRRHLEHYAQVDIALDTFPYHGTTTTCEALWMGVPVITLAGHTHASRVGVSLLTHAGLPELIASSADEYVHIATRLAADIERLGTLRSSLRERLAVSRLLDAPRFARNVEHAYRQMWRTWCATPSTSPSS